MSVTLTSPIAEVIVDLRVHDVDRVFHYSVPDGLIGNLKVGHRVVVPFGRRPRVEGYVVGLLTSTDRPEVKPISAVLDELPLLSEASISVAKWMRDRYLCTLAQALQCFLPPGSRLRSKQKARSQTVLAYRVVDLERARAALPELEVRAPKQARVLRYLLSASGARSSADVTRRIGVSRAPLTGLVEKGLAEALEVPVGRRPLRDAAGPSRAPYRLNASQQSALDFILERVERREPSAHLLQGVTGSGKTEVYLQVIRETVRRGMGAILLVPEIALTEQTVAHLQAMFGSTLAVLHSRLSLGERFDQWHMIRRGEINIVVGARSAVFAPVQNLGLIILDEEHETSYKQEESPRYHARDVGWARAKAEHATLLLGSATPALETRLEADRGRRSRIVLSERIDGRPLPSIEVVDMREELAAGNRSVFSRVLLDSLSDVIDRGEQAVLFINRRGFASFLLCRECGYVPRCTQCEVSLTYHQPEGLRCHYCDAHADLPASCPECGGPYLRPFGGGTQRVEHELRKVFPAARPVRMDVDTTRRKGAHGKILRAFGRGEYDVLIGTQMIAKGLHFPEVTLVGVVSADTGLHFPDFRAAERTFQLLTQVAGRSGRGEREGRVYIQTYAPDHYAIRAAQAHDYEGFYQFELGFRERAGYPPFVSMIRCLWSGEAEEDVVRTAQQGWASLLQLNEEDRPDVVGPCPAPLARLKGRYRWHLILKGPLEKVRAAVLHLRSSHPGRDDVRLAIDVDPTNML